jgi:hypothetical protein
VPGGDRVDIALEDVNRSRGFEVIVDAFLLVGNFDHAIGEPPPVENRD